MNKAVLAAGVLTVFGLLLTGPHGVYGQEKEPFQCEQYTRLDNRLTEVAFGFMAGAEIAERQRELNCFVIGVSSGNNISAETLEAVCKQEPLLSDKVRVGDIALRAAVYCEANPSAPLSHALRRAAYDLQGLIGVEEGVGSIEEGMQ